MDMMDVRIEKSIEIRTFFQEVLNESVVFWCKGNLVKDNRAFVGKERANSGKERMTIYENKGNGYKDLKILNEIEGYFVNIFAPRMKIPMFPSKK